MPKQTGNTPPIQDQAEEEDEAGLAGTQMRATRADMGTMDNLFGEIDLVPETQDDTQQAPQAPGT